MRCKEPGCKNVPEYNYNNRFNPAYCYEHKKPEMIEITEELVYSQYTNYRSKTCVIM